MAHENETDEESKEFVLLKTICAEILRTPNEANLTGLNKMLDNVSHLEDGKSEFIIFPIAVHLKFLGKLKEKERIALFCCLTKILDKSEIKSIDLFLEMFQRLNVALVLKEEPTVLNSKLSEQELDSIISATLALVRSSLTFHFDNLYNDKRIKIVGFFIFVLLEIINVDTWLKTRLQALQILEVLVVSCSGKAIACGLMFGFFPGIISSVRKSCSTKVGKVREKLVLKSLYVMGQTIKVCISHMKADCLVQADQNLAVVIDIICDELVIHESTLYRKAVSEFSTELIAAASDKLPNCLEILWRNVWILRSDEDPLITKTTVTFLNSFPEETLCYCTFEHVMKLTKRLMSLHRNNDQKSCLLLLKQVSSVLTILKINFAELHTYLPVIFSLSDQCLSLRNFTDYVNDIRLDPIVLVCSKVCQSIFHSANLNDILDEFTSCFAEFQSTGNSNSLSKGVIFCFNEILRAYYKDVQTPKKDSAIVLEPYQILNLANMYISVLDSNSTEVAISVISEETLNIQSEAEKKKCLFLEGLTILTQISPPYILPVSLYMLIENAGTKDSTVVSSVASGALQDLANSLSDTNGSLKSLMTKNIDLVMGELSVRISNLSEHPNCPNAFLFLAEYFDFSVEDFVELVDQVFEKSCDEFNGGYMQLVYAKIFFAFVSSLSLQKQKSGSEGINKDEDCRTQLPQRSSGANKTLLNKLVDYQASVGIELDNEKSSSKVNQNEDMPANSENDQKGEYDDHEDRLSADLSLVLRITRRVLNFLPNNERTVRLIAMDSLIKGVPILRSYENALLPLAHTIWQNLVPRLSEKDYVVVRKSFELLLILCTTCGPFLRKRTLEEVFPKLSSLLIALAVESKKVKNKFRQYYTYTQGYKLQLTVLEGLAQLCESIEVGEEDLMKVVDGAILYLENEQHKNLRDASRHLLECISNGPNCRSIWFSLVANGLKEVPSTVHCEFLPLPPELSVNGNSQE